MARATRIVVAAALVAGTFGTGRPAAAGPSGWCTFDEKTGIVRIGGAAQLAVGATKEGVLGWGEAPVWNPNWFDFTVCNGGGKFVTLDVVERIDITSAAGGTTRGDHNWVFVFDQAFAGTAPEKGAPPSGLAHERISVMGPGSLQLSAHLGPTNRPSRCGRAASTAMATASSTSPSSRSRTSSTCSLVTCRAA
jgi:hypothetical protein